MDFILEHLAIGDAREAADPPDEITALLCVARELELPAVPVRSSRRIPVVDMRPIADEQLHEAVQWIAGAIGRERLLVYCNAGVGRSPSVVVGYLCCARGCGFGQAVEFVARRRPYMSTLPDLIRGIDRVAAAWR